MSTLLIDSAVNVRVLVVDDEEEVRRSIAQVLSPPTRDFSRLEQAADALFGADELEEESEEVRRKSGLTRFAVTQAATGQQALSAVQAASERGDPYSLAFVDIRMPGWNGIETAERLRAVDPRLAIVFVTAQDLGGVDELIERTGCDISYLCKPFAPEEIRQHATRAVFDWHRMRLLERLVEMGSDIGENALGPDAMVERVLQSATGFMGAECGLVHTGNQRDGYRLTHRYGFEDAAAAQLWLNGIGPSLNDERPFAVASDAVGIRMGERRVVIGLQGVSAYGPVRLQLLQLLVTMGARQVETCRLREDSVRREKLSAVGQALGKVVHDLRSPLGAIHGAVDIARESSEDPELVSEMLDLVTESADEALATVSEVLEFVRDVRIEPVATAVDTMVDRVLRQLRVQAEEAGVKLTRAGDAGLRADIDEKKLARGLMNLTRNAIEAQVPAQAGVSAEVVVRIESIASGLPPGNLRFVIADNGAGVPEEALERMFEPFVTVGKAGGTGLGLPIARQVAEAHGGHVRHRRVSGWTEFVVDLPEVAARLESA